MTLAEFFSDFPASRSLFDALLPLIQDLGPLTMAVTKSQIAFRRARPFAWVWIPERYLRRKAAPLVLSLAFPSPDPSPRWKEIVEPACGRFMHHLEIYSPTDLDGEVIAWLRSAWELAG